jgi:hypothetical protein
MARKETWDMTKCESGEMSAPAGGLSPRKQLPLALIVTTPNTENGIIYGSSAEARS